MHRFPRCMFPTGPSQLRSCRNILRCPGTDHRIWFPTCLATQVSHADMSGCSWSTSLMSFPWDGSRQRARHHYLSWCPTGSFKVFAGRLLSANILYLHHCMLRDGSYLLVSDQSFSNDVRHACISCLLSVYVRLVSNRLVAAGSRRVAIR